jgi:hypothetical protein
MADQKISQLAAAAALTGTELVPIVQSSSTVSTTPAAIKTYATAELVSTYGFGNTARNVPDMTATAVNVSQIGRLLAGATGGTGVNSSFVALPVDGTPTISYLAATSGRFWVGYKNSAGGTPTWTEFAKLDSPAITTRMAVGGPVSTQALINANTAASVTGNVIQYGINMTPTIASDVTTSYYGVRSAAPTAAASFTLPLWCGFQAGMTSVGAGSTITNAYGFIADQSVGSSAQVTNAYGLYSNLASGIGTSRWNLYNVGTAPNYMAGGLGIGSTGVTGFNLRVDRNMTGATTFVAMRNAGTAQSDVTASLTMYDSVPFTAGATYTLPILAHYRVQGATANAPSIISNQYGFRVLNNLTAATNNFAFQSDLAAAANVWNIYFADTAQNFIRGNVGIGSGKTAPACALDVNGQVAQNTATAVTAAGTTLATATALTATFNVVATTPASSGVTLPDVTGTAIWVFNNGANALTVYPNSASGTINGGTAGAGVTLAVGGKMQYVRVSATAWFTMS